MLFVDGGNDRVGIGTASPNKQFTVSSTGQTDVLIESANDNKSQLHFGDPEADNIGRVAYDNANNDLSFWTNTTERMAIDSSGNVGIGVTPESWEAAATTLQVGAGGAVYAGGNDIALTSNFYHDGTHKYINSHYATMLYTSNGKHVFRTAPSGSADAAITWTTAMTIENDGDVTVDTGNLVIGTSGKGIDFSATSDGTTMSSELLDDYEEGTFVPTMLGSTSGNFVASTNDTLSYTKVGRLVTVTGKLSVDTDNSCSGTIMFSLPFTAATQSKQEFSTAGGVMIRSGGTEIPNNQSFIIGGGGTNGYIMFMQDNSVSENIASTNVDAAWDVWFGYTYCAA
jgi:hypothetical protein